ncbi:MAG TPA: MBL fold metallo-hydrolase [Candidatus Syntrophosphaera sp.]|nr:MBL fold metallo-hydrolase [Candidatus Syntrophosphaera thermopropionivorans]HOJ41764.1 MBL fold metallo-hydrolase [Candidatus Syntrophosphaera thermopropionivorans]HOL33354.1 MBL fold metallo-hydrolase [Candidatus Syntrophosphaera thermopropionivorans]HPQ30723.1 MBL fold metallo-hydrolase [Candidatus Syntrophosphaera thermopropionivorans]HRQ98793.1 MBL fold metallo-hydrolase [Candidatus Syntrophosphaera sp.]
MLKIEGYILLPDFETNTWLLWDEESREAILVDPAAPSPDLLKRIEELKLKVKYIINTHGHMDHIGGNSWFKNHLSAPLMIHSADAPMLVNSAMNLSLYVGNPVSSAPPDVLLEDGMELSLGKYPVKVIHTPGHTPGGICLLADKFLISGDTLFEQSIGRTDLQGGNHQQIINSIKNKLFVLPDDVIVFPGHGPRTSIGMEKKNNPFVS